MRLLGIKFRPSLTKNSIIQNESGLLQRDAVSHFCIYTGYFRAGGAGGVFGEGAGAAGGGGGAMAGFVFIFGALAGAGALAGLGGAGYNFSIPRDANPIFLPISSILPLN